ncbi:hypothetical protein SAMN02927914_04815 [Mesorhizobium qingshengii]|uniref:Uncharacterized protein n=1 Tax=Mesorhizobium qingshengii TaxID=1165689 RepID=A0A1G5ZDR6_9HYPH|nr:hypothetical protein SAMN02927914_04815 [Mesorhizobium qingshengii]
MTCLRLRHAVQRNDLRLSRVIRGPSKKVFCAWTKPELLRQARMRMSTAALAFAGFASRRSQSPSTKHCFFGRLAEERTITRRETTKVGDPHVHRNPCDT